jgi:hypothetical protein
MDINVFLGTMGSRLGIIMDNTVEFCKLDYEVIRRPIGHLSGIDAIGGVESLSFNLCKNQINFQIESIKQNNFNNHKIFFTGIGCSIYAKELINEYPDFNYYFIKNKYNVIDERTIDKLLDLADITKDWIEETNKNVTTVFDNLTNQLNLNWIPYSECTYLENKKNINRLEDIIIAKYSK